MKMTIQSIPSTLDVNELMGVKGGFLGIHICFGGSSSTCEGGVGTAKCEAGVSAVTVITPQKPVNPDPEPNPNPGKK